MSFLKVNVIEWLDFELTNYDSTVQHFNHYTMETHPQGIFISQKRYIEI